MCDVGQNISNTKKEAFDRGPENQNPSNSNLGEAGYYFPWKERRKDGERDREKEKIMNELIT
jgi:hypothetical protein